MDHDTSIPPFIQIQLPDGSITLIDSVDSDLAKLKWRLSSPGYAHRTKSQNYKRISIALHRLILERVVGRPLLKDDCADHINGDRLDNRRANLRLASRDENSRNRGMHKNSKSGYKGVSWSQKLSKWQAFITTNSRKKFLGRFNDIKDAARAYNTAAILYHGEFARLNIIED